MSTFTVTNLQDSGTGSLRAAITSANGGAGNTVDASGVSGMIVLQTALPTVTQNMTITGPLTANGLILYSIVNGPDIFVHNSGILSISNFTCLGSQNAFHGTGFATTNITNCTVSGAGSAFAGSISDTCNVMNCTFINCLGFGIQNNNILSVTNSILWNNASGAIHNVSGVSFSCIQGGAAGTGNISTDPLLQNFYNGILAVSVFSPCNGTGTHTGAPATDQRGVTRANPPSMGSWDGGLVSTFTVLGGYTAAGWLQATALSGNIIQLSWDCANQISTAWDVFRSTSAGTETLLASSVVTTNNGIRSLYYSDTGLVNGTTYYYKVAPHGTTTYTNEASATSVTNGTFTELARLPQPYRSVSAKVDPAATDPHFSINSPSSIQTVARMPREIVSPYAASRGIGRIGLFGPGE